MPVILVGKHHHDRQVGAADFFPVGDLAGEDSLELLLGQALDRRHVLVGQHLDPVATDHLGFVILRVGDGVAFLLHQLQPRLETQSPRRHVDSAFLDVDKGLIRPFRGQCQLKAGRFLERFFNFLENVFYRRRAAADLDFLGGNARHAKTQPQSRDQTAHSKRAHHLFHSVHLHVIGLLID